MRHTFKKYPALTYKPLQWLRFLAAVLLPRRAYLLAVYHHPGRLAYLRKLLTAPLREPAPLP